MIEELVEFLERYGWNIEDADKADLAYGKAGVNAAQDTVRWMDDSEHDYSGEMADCIRQWEYECGNKFLPEMRTIRIL